MLFLGPKLPAPTWHGFGTNGIDRYAAFMRRHQEAVVRELPVTLQAEVNSYNSSIRSMRTSLAAARTNKAAAEEAVVELRKLIDNPLSDEELATELHRLTDLPYVIGTRTDSHGRLLVQFRVTYADAEGKYDFGDYELGLIHQPHDYYRHDNERTGHQLSVIRKPSAMSRYTVLSKGEPEVEGNVIRGWFNLPQYYIPAGLLVRLMELTVEEIVSSVIRREGGLDRFKIKEDSPEPETIWEGQVTNLLKAYKRAVTMLPRNPLGNVLRVKEKEVAQLVKRIDNYLEDIRLQQQGLRKARAELTEAENALQNFVKVEIDREQATQDFDYIAQLPGVMGIRFENDGTPVIHIRSSHVYEGKRYDLGDVELSLTKEGRNDSRSVVKIRSTRVLREHMFLHNAGSENTWFCFGGLADELERYFDEGNMQTFLHAAINAMNSVNEGYRTEYYLDQYFKRIPIDMTWRHYPKPTRPRRRRGRVEEVATNV